MNQFKNYKVEERVGKMLETKSVKQVLANCEAELNSYNDMLSMYSSDCLGHGITFNQLAITYLKTMIN